MKLNYKYIDTILSTGPARVITPEQVTHETKVPHPPRKIRILISKLPMIR